VQQTMEDVTKTQTALTSMELSPVPANQDTPEMDSPVQVDKTRSFCRVQRFCFHFPSSWGEIYVV